MHRTRVGRHASRAQARDSKPAVASTSEDADTIDARYGLEPVFEAGAAGSSERGGSCFKDIHCPYCGEPFETLVDLSAGSADYIEDCQVCCRPIQFHLEVDHEGALTRLTAARGE
ncbi:MAG TPA: CPXCG motif-containing cysteine-rich protein [Steroidobacteraceae bacterium]|jgi:hypothetical protein|nr:CPXCG motif-containing cysteine-rich protein [Steroidobacteraceae bacterium]